MSTSRFTKFAYFDWDSLILKYDYLLIELLFTRMKSFCFPYLGFDCQALWTLAQWASRFSPLPGAFYNKVCVCVCGCVCVCVLRHIDYLYYSLLEHLEVIWHWHGQQDYDRFVRLSLWKSIELEGIMIDIMFCVRVIRLAVESYRRCNCNWPAVINKVKGPVNATVLYLSDTQLSLHTWIYHDLPALNFKSSKSSLLFPTLNFLRG